MADTESYDVFISYSELDYLNKQKEVLPGNVITRITDSLTEAGISYWIGRGGDDPGEDFVDKIVSKIDSSRVFVFISTENSNNKSRFTSKEISFADAKLKPIIPVRIDKSAYKNSVLFRISDIDQIDFYANPEKGIVDLIAAIKTHLALIEKEKGQFEREQEKLVRDIKLTCETLNANETNLDIERQKLLLRVDGVIDNDQRDSLVRIIKNGGVIHQRFENQLSGLEKEIEELKKQEYENKKSSTNRYTFNIFLSAILVVCSSFQIFDYFFQYMPFKGVDGWGEYFYVYPLLGILLPAIGYLSAYWTIKQKKWSLFLAIPLMSLSAISASIDILINNTRVGGGWFVGLLTIGFLYFYSFNKQQMMKSERILLSTFSILTLTIYLAFQCADHAGLL